MNLWLLGVGAMMFGICLPTQIHGTCSDEFQKEMLFRNNEYRANHNSPPLVYDEAAHASAQRWVEHIAAIDKVEWEPKSPYGPNGALHTHFPTATEVAREWYCQITKYKWFPDGPPFGTGIDVGLSTWGFFSQLVWKESHKFGVGCATSASGKTYVLAYYGPQGNYPYQAMFKGNVTSPIRNLCG